MKESARKDLDKSLKKILDLPEMKNLRRIVDITSFDTLGIPIVSTCIRNVALDQYSYGRGFEFRQSITSALMEAYEYTCFSAESIARLRGRTWGELDSKLRPPSELFQLTSPQLVKFSQTKRYDWIKCDDLIRNKKTLLPDAFFTFPDSRSKAPFRVTRYRTSIGKATGVDVKSATLHALYELIERDAAMIYNFEDSPRILPNHWPLKIRKYLALLRRQKIASYCFDISTDIEVPVFAFCLLQKRGASYLFSEGMAAHSRPEQAMVSAFLEAAQSRASYFFAKQRWMGNNLISQKARDRFVGRWGAAPLSAPVARQKDKSVGDLLSILRARGIDHVYAAEVSRPNSPFPAISCFVPQLEIPLFAEGDTYWLGPRAQAAMVKHQL